MKTHHLHDAHRDGSTLRDVRTSNLDVRGRLAEIGAIEAFKDGIELQKQRRRLKMEIESDPEKSRRLDETTKAIDEARQAYVKEGFEVGELFTGITPDFLLISVDVLANHGPYEAHYVTRIRNLAVDADEPFTQEDAALEETVIRDNILYLGTFDIPDGHFHSLIVPPLRPRQDQPDYPMFSDRPIFPLENGAVSVVDPVTK